MVDTSDFHFKNEYIHGEYRTKTKYGGFRAKIHVFCPPFLDYIHIALAFALPNEGLRTCEFQVMIHPDHRLLDEKLYSAEEARESLLQLCDFVYSEKLGNSIDSVMLPRESEHRSRFLAARFDQVWMDRCLMALSLDECHVDPFDFYQIFKECKKDEQIELIIVMAGPQVCDSITSVPPVATLGYPMQQSQIYKLEYIDGANDDSLIRWKPSHFCSIQPPSTNSNRL